MRPAGWALARLLAGAGILTATLVVMAVLAALSLLLFAFSMGSILLSSAGFVAGAFFRWLAEEAGCQLHRIGRLAEALRVASQGLWDRLTRVSQQEPATQEPAQPEAVSQKDDIDLAGGPKGSRSLRIN